MKLKTAIILVNWNTTGLTIECLESIFKMDRSNDFRVILVDNDSSDNPVDLFRNKYPQIKVIEAGQNLGFTGANNLGARTALNENTDYIWFLNNDTEADHSALRLTEAFEDSSVGAAGSKILFAKGYEYHQDRYAKEELGRVIWYAGGIIDWQNMYARHIGVDEVDAGQFDISTDTQFVTGCSFMIRKDVLEKVGFFDDRYFPYLEDVDLSLRIIAKGYRLIYYPKSVIRHKNAASSGKPGSQIHEYYQTRNRLLLGMSYASFRTKIALVREAGRQLTAGRKNQKKGIIDALLNRWGRYHE